MYITLGSTFNNRNQVFNLMQWYSFEFFIDISLLSLVVVQAVYFPHAYVVYVFVNWVVHWENPIIKYVTQSALTHIWIEEHTVELTRNAFECFNNSFH